MNYAHLVYGMQMAFAARAWMYKQPQEDWENFLSGVNGFLNQAEADMRNRGGRQCFALLTKRNLHNGKSFFIIWSHVVSQKITRV
jgi:queuine/archaeosine tRNA-ribosyltransferase